MQIDINEDSDYSDPEDEHLLYDRSQKTTISTGNRPTRAVGCEASDQGDVVKMQVNLSGPGMSANISVYMRAYFEDGSTDLGDGTSDSGSSATHTPQPTAVTLASV